MEKDTSLESGFEVLTSLRWTTLAPDGMEDASSSSELPQLDGIPIHYHVDRLLSAASALNWPTVVNFLSDITGLDLLRAKLLAFSSTLPSQSSTYKLRLTVSSTGTVSITASPPIESSLFPFSLADPSALTTTLTNLATVYLAPNPITTSIFTTHKTTDRDPYTQALSSLPSSITSLPPTTAEVLLFNSSNQITECVYSTPYFKRGDEIITPHSSCGGNLGVTRRLALERGWCVEGIITRESVTDGEVVWLSNAFRGFWAARVRLDVLGA